MVIVVGSSDLLTILDQVHLVFKRVSFKEEEQFEFFFALIEFVVEFFIVLVDCGEKFDAEFIADGEVTILEVNETCCEFIFLVFKLHIVEIYNFFDSCLEICADIYNLIVKLPFHLLEKFDIILCLVVLATTLQVVKLILKLLSDSSNLGFKRVVEV